LPGVVAELVVENIPIGPMAQMAVPVVLPKVY
jgi:hypothetical protein